MNIHVILTGDTIDSYYGGSMDTAVPLKHSAIPRYLKNLKLYHRFQYTELCMKDSRAITDTDRRKMVQVIKRARTPYIIITHGTYTMPQTARFIEQQLSAKYGKTVILTGSMIPLDGFTFSDGGFNLGYAIGKLHCAAPGVYVAMNGKLFPAKTATKIVSKGRFAEIQ